MYRNFERFYNGPRSARKFLSCSPQKGKFKSCHRFLAYCWSSKIIQSIIVRHFASDDDSLGALPSPYLGILKFGKDGRRGYQIPKSGSPQLVRNLIFIYKNTLTQLYFSDAFQSRRQRFATYSYSIRFL